MWKIGPEWAAQQAKNVSASTANCGERSAWAAVRPAPLPDGARGDPWPAVAGGWRTRSAAGISRIQAAMPMVSMAVRQS